MISSTYRKCEQEKSIGETHDYRDTDSKYVVVGLLLCVVFVASCEHEREVRIEEAILYE
jgi:hypothetical protein